MHDSSSWSCQTHQHLLLVESLEALLLEAAPAGACFANALRVLRSSQRSDLRYVEGWYVVLVQEAQYHPRLGSLMGSLSVTLSQHGWLEVEADGGSTGILDPTLAQELLMHPLPIWTLYFPGVRYCQPKVEQLLTQTDTLPLIWTDGRAAALRSYQKAYQRSCLVAASVLACQRTGLAGSASVAAQAVIAEWLRLPPLSLPVGPQDTGGSGGTRQEEQEA
ncbi:hypothetical protein [Thermogemmatispora carboxidivorans]|uniref:hypothetical protein n=1 Tax=Thermogemmatispora carboxidivorans TaxID=1382306 RepID=UPI00069BB51D|nr:hypothetical protein [Thermogemmatispora carboxidivorans]